MAAVITTGGVLRYLLKDPDDLGQVLEGIAHGYRLGTEAKPFLAQKLEEGWDRPLAEWRTELNVEPRGWESAGAPARFARIPSRRSSVLRKNCG